MLKIKELITRVRTRLNKLSSAWKAAAVIIGVVTVFAFGFAVSQALGGKNQLASLSTDSAANSSTSANGSTGNNDNDSGVKTENESSNTDTTTKDGQNTKKSSTSNGSNSTNTGTGSGGSPSPTPIVNRPDYNLNNEFVIGIVGGMSCTIPAAQVTEENEASVCIDLGGGCGKYSAVANSASEASTKATNIGNNSQPAGKYFLPKCGATAPLDEEGCGTHSLSCGRW